MNQDRKSFAFPLKHILIIFSASAVSLIVFLAIAARVLLNVDHFERFYEAVCWAVFAAEGLFLASAARLLPDKAGLVTCCVVILVSLFVIITGLISGDGSIDLSRLGMRLALYAGISAAALLVPRKRNKRPAKKFKR